MDVVGANIRKMRVARGLLQKELAALAEISPSNLSKLEQGKYTWTKKNLRLLADALHVDVGAFFMREMRLPVVGEPDAMTPVLERRLLNLMDRKLDRILTYLSDEEKKRFG